MSTGTFPARLHALFAQDTLDAVVIRRGPSKRTAIIAWDRKSDIFTLGRWLNARIYERRSDLSPDGKHLIYFAMNGKWHDIGSWTAISKAPYSSELALFSKDDCWNGGGLFESAHSYWLNDLNNGYGHKQVHDDGSLERTLAAPWPESYGGECPGVYYVRLQKSGWVLTHTYEPSRHEAIHTFEKSLNSGWVLRKLANADIHHPVGKGCYYDTHSLVQAKDRKSVV